MHPLFTRWIWLVPCRWPLMASSDSARLIQGQPFGFGELMGQKLILGLLVKILMLRQFLRTLARQRVR